MLSIARLYFLSRSEVLLMLSETRDPNLVQSYLHLCFAGIQSLEFDDLQEAHAMISGKGNKRLFLK
jgi:dynein heavy chain